MIAEQNQSPVQAMPKFLPSLSNGRLFILNTSPQFIATIRFTKKRTWVLSYPNEFDSEEFDEITDDMIDYCREVVFPLLIKKGYVISDNGLLVIQDKGLNTISNLDFIENT